MTTYYVSPSGSDANNGLGPDASHATNKPWLTLGKVVTTGSSVAPGDTVWFGPGYYWEGAERFAISGISSVGSPTSLRGDPHNAQGFKTSGGVRLAPGRVYISSHTSSEGDSNPAATSFILNLYDNNCQGLQLYNLCLQGRGMAGVGGAVKMGAGANQGTLFQDCSLFGGTAAISFANGTPTAARNVTIRRCLLIGAQYGVNLNVGVAAATADADLNINIEHCLIFGRVVLGLGNSAGGNTAGGVHLKGCTIIGAYNLSGYSVPGLTNSHSTVTPSTMEGCLFIGGGGMAAAFTTGQIVSNGYNKGTCIQNNMTNVTYGTGDVDHVPTRLILPDLYRDKLSIPSGDWFAWHPDAHANQLSSGWGNTEPDFYGRTARPWGAGASVGYIESGHISQDTGSQITGGGANSLKITGAGEISFFLPVEASVALTITIKTESSSYGGTNYPQAIITANPSLSVTQQTATASSATEQTLTLGPFTPGAAGVVELRLISRSSSTTSATFFDSLEKA